MFGAIGYVDDIFITIFVLLLIIGGFAIMYIRGRQWSVLCKIYFKLYNLNLL